MINLLFCKLLEEQETPPDDPVTFKAGVGKSHLDTSVSLHLSANPRPWIVVR